MHLYYVIILRKQDSIRYLIIPENVCSVSTYVQLMEVMEVDYKLLCRGLSHAGCVKIIMSRVTPETPYTIELIPDPLSN